MAKKLIRIKDLIPGMYVDEINCSLKDRDRIGETKHFLVISKNEIDRFVALGIQELYINPEKGLDYCSDEEERKKANIAIAELARLKNAQNSQEPKPLEDELYDARMLAKKARGVLENAIKSYQAGEKIMTDTAMPLLDEISRKAQEKLGQTMPDAKKAVILAALERARLRKAGKAPAQAEARGAVVKKP